jgi:hypothetical protein
VCVYRVWRFFVLKGLLFKLLQRVCGLFVQGCERINIRLPDHCLTITFLSIDRVALGCLMREVGQLAICRICTLDTLCNTDYPGQHIFEVCDQCHSCSGAAGAFVSSPQCGRRASPAAHWVPVRTLLFHSSVVLTTDRSLCKCCDSGFLADIFGGVQVCRSGVRAARLNHQGQFADRCEGFHVSAHSGTHDPLGT